MRVAALALLALLAAGCGAAQSSRPVKLASPSAADATRAQWYADVKRTGAPDALPDLSEREIRQAVHDGAVALGVSGLTLHYLPGLGGAADIVVEPEKPVSFATTAGRKLTTLLGPLDDNRHAYLVTVADPKGRPLFVLGWAPGVEQGEGIAWQAPGIRSDAIIGQPELGNKLPQGCRGAEPCTAMAPAK
jgi:hypothetical protein